MTDPVNGWEVFIAFATGASALGTCAATIVIAYQAIMTKRAVDVAQLGADVSRDIAAETIKTRLDARARVSLEVIMNGEVEWPPLEPSDFGDAQPIPLGTEYHLPRDKAKRLTIRMPVRFQNLTARTLSLQLNQLAPTHWLGRERAPSTWTLDPNAAYDMVVYEERSVEEWAAIYVDRANGLPGAGTNAMISHSDDYEDGVVDRWELELGGTPLSPALDRGDTWLLPTGPNEDATGRSNIGGVLYPMERRYFLSKRQGKRL